MNKLLALLLLLPTALLAGEGTGSILGRVVYYSNNAGTPVIDVAAHLVQGQPPVDNTTLIGPAGDYDLGGLPPDSYFISAFVDFNGSGGPPDPGEPLGWYDADGDCQADAVDFVDANLEGIDIALGNIIYVDADAAGMDDGTCWDNAYNYLRDALAMALADSEIWVAGGTYRPTTETDRNATLPMKNGVAIHGGFAGDEILRWPRDWTEDPTILSGEIGAPGNGDNSYHVVTALNANASAILSAVVVANGYADGIGGALEQGGGLFSDNRGTSPSDGPTITNVVFTNNFARLHGGAVAAQASSPTIVNCEFTGNISGVNGAGVAALNSVPAPPGNPLIVNGTFANNLNTVASQATIAKLDSSTATVHNTVVWDNTLPAIGDYGSGASPVISYSIIEGGFAGDENLDQDPLYFDLDGEDNTPGNIDDELDPIGGSPAIDSGDNAQVPRDLADLDSDGDRSEPTPLDVYGQSRFRDDPSAPDGGSGSAPVVDRGAHESQRGEDVFEDGFEWTGGMTNGR